FQGFGGGVQLSQAEGRIFCGAPSYCALSGSGRAPTTEATSAAWACAVIASTAVAAITPLTILFISTLLHMLTRLSRASRCLTSVDPVGPLPFPISSHPIFLCEEYFHIWIILTSGSRKLWLPSHAVIISRKVVFSPRFRQCIRFE